MTACFRLGAALLLVLLLPACVSQTVKTTAIPALERPAESLSEELLLDVGVVVFDPGLDDYDEDQQIYPEVRKAEARFMPRLLAEAMQNSGGWGAVRVIPSDRQLVDLLVQGTIIKSDGEELELHINARDARGQQWLDQDYSAHASRYAYDSTTRSSYDPFQAIYHMIANDLLRQQQRLKAAEREDIRLVTELLFARSFSPDAFDGYLQQNRKGTLVVKRLPATEDPMLERIRSIRERDQLFVDTLQDHYGHFSGEMQGPYQEWRKMSYEEAVALQELRAESRRRLLAGGAAILAGIYAASSSDGSARAAGNVAIIGGGYMLKSGLDKRAEAQIHVAALEELGMSLEAEITPQVIELEDRTVMLSGNVEEQYEQWRELLADIYRAEVGMLDLPDATITP
ncbi:MAG: hypothetical protein RJQ10_02895 [Haliea sp.]|uniref:hypothetical protein n=1 Tax=Haliea sp. TaxID=1932666 RepID=UPI0032EAFC0C